MTLNVSLPVPTREHHCDDCNCNCNILTSCGTHCGFSLSLWFLTKKHTTDSACFSWFAAVPGILSHLKFEPETTLVRHVSVGRCVSLSVPRSVSVTELVQ